MVVRGIGASGERWGRRSLGGNESNIRKYSSRQGRSPKLVSTQRAHLHLLPKKPLHGLVAAPSPQSRQAQASGLAWQSTAIDIGLGCEAYRATKRDRKRMQAAAVDTGQISDPQFGTKMLLDKTERLFRTGHERRYADSGLIRGSATHRRSSSRLAPGVARAAQA